VVSDPESGSGAHTLVPVENGTKAWHVFNEIARTSLFKNKKKQYYRDLKYFEEEANKRMDFLLSFNAKALGTIALEALEEGSAAIRMVAIHHRYQGRGHGIALGILVEEFAKAHGMKRLCVNADPVAIGYYRRLGFAPEVWSKDELESFCQSRVLPIQMVKNL
jgi:N-acetylglutamate synthase-like GNAT family acetyltransferase